MKLVLLVGDGVLIRNGMLVPAGKFEAPDGSKDIVRLLVCGAGGRTALLERLMIRSRVAPAFIIKLKVFEPVTVYPFPGAICVLAGIVAVKVNAPSGKAVSLRKLVLFVTGLVLMLNGMFVPPGKFDAPLGSKETVKLPMAKTDGTVFRIIAIARRRDEDFFQICARSVFIERDKSI
jgi:hypothetical protein